jgi:hypothetical protein
MINFVSDRGLTNEDIGFGGYPVKMMHDSISGTTIITCKEVTGTLGQLEDWLFNHYKDPYTKYYFGYGDKRSEIVRDGEDVKIACLKENYLEFKLKLNKFIHGVGRNRG